MCPKKDIQAHQVQPDEVHGVLVEVVVVLFLVPVVQLFIVAEHVGQVVNHAVELPGREFLQGDVGENLTV